MVQGIAHIIIGGGGFVGGAIAFPTIQRKVYPTLYFVFAKCEQLFERMGLWGWPPDSGGEHERIATHE